MTILEIPLYQLTESAPIVKVEHNLHASSVDIATAATGRKRNWTKFDLSP
jgi:hypothetical protein